MMTIDDMISGLAKEGAKKRFPSPLKILLGWAVLLLLYTVGVLVYFPIRPDFGEVLKRLSFLVQLGIAIVMVVSAAVSASYLALPDSNQKSWVRLLPLWPFILLMGMLIVAVAALGSAGLAGCLEMQQVVCAKAVFLFSALPSIVMMYTIQRAAPIHYFWAASMAGLAGSGIGYVFLLLIEPHENPAHLLIWHFLPVLFTMLVAISLGKFVLGRWQRVD
jgi:hypothetical protein